MAREDRNHTRIAFETEVVLHSNAYHYPLEAELINISVGGAYLKTEDLIPLGYDCQIDIILTGTSCKVTISIEGTIIRRDKEGLGIKFNEGVAPWAILPLYSVFGSGKKGVIEP